MANINLFIPTLLKYEGGYVNNKEDKGGITNKGITLSTYQSFFGKNKTAEDLKSITDEQVKQILKTNYWDKLNADLINNQSVGEICVDWLYNSGLSQIKHIQGIIGTNPDGVFGEQSISRINRLNQSELHQKIKLARIEFYQSIVKNNPKQKVFLNGWMNRINSFTFK